MTTTTAHLMFTANATHSGLAGARRPVRRQQVDLAPWIAPFAWMTVLAITVCALGGAAMLRDGVPSPAATTIAVRVAPSDTLWSIAEASRLPGVSTARTVEAIARINGLRGTTILAGAVLYVPATEVVDATFAQAGDPTIIR